jgi:hypothetical protein
MQSADSSLHHSSTGHLLDKAFDMAESLGRCIWALESYTPDGEGLQKDVKLWSSLLEELGVYRMPEHSLKCLRYPAIKQYEHILKDHVLDLRAKYGELIQYSSWFLESNHKYAKFVLRHHSTQGGGHADGEEEFLHVQRQCLRHLSNSNACYRQEIFLIDKQTRLQQDCRDQLLANHVLQDGSSPRSAGRSSCELSEGEKENPDYIDEYNRSPCR